MAKIPTYNNMATPTGNFVKPGVATGQLTNIKKIVDYSNQVLDQKAATEGYEQGVAEQQKTLEQGGLILAQAQNPNTIRGSAYQKGAKTAYVSAVKNKADSYSMELFNKHQQNPELYTLKEFEEDYKQWSTETLADMPVDLQPTLNDYITGKGNQIGQSIFTSELNIQKDKDRAQIIKRIDLNLIPDISNAIKTEDHLSEALPGLLSELYEDLDNPLISESDKLSIIKQVKSNVLQASILSHYNNPNTNKTEFIDQLNSGDSTVLDNVLSDFNETYNEQYGIDFGSTLTLGELSTYGSFAQKYHNSQTRLFAVDKAKFKNSFDTEIALLESGQATDFVFDSTRALELGYDPDEIELMQRNYNNALQIQPVIDQSKQLNHTDLSNSVNDLENQLEEIIQLPPSDDKYDQLYIVQNTLTALEKEKERKLDEMDKGNFEIGLKRAEIEYDLTTKDGVESYYKQAAQLYGISEDRIKLPNQVIDEFKNDFSTIETQADFVRIMEGTYGTLGDNRIAQLLVDSELDEQPYSVVFEMYQYDKNVAYSLYTSIKNSDALEDSLENRYGENFKDDLKEFQATFETEMGSQLAFDANLNNGLFSGMKAFWLKNYESSKGDVQKATDSTLKYFTDKLFQRVTILDEEYLIPNHLDGEKIKTTYEDIFENPQRYGIFTNNQFTAEDFKNNAQNYRPVIKGNTVYIQQAEGGFTTAQIYQKLPSGQTDLVLSTVGFNSTGEGSNLYMKDIEATWEYDKSESFNDDLDNILKTTTEEVDIQIRGGITKKSVKTIVPTADVNEAAEELRKLFRTSEQDAEGKVNYADLYAGEITTNPTEQDTLNAVSYYIKDGSMQPWLLDYLAENYDAFDFLNTTGVKEQVLTQWTKENIQSHIKSTSSDAPIVMSPLASLIDFIKSIEPATVDPGYDYPAYQVDKLVP